MAFQQITNEEIQQGLPIDSGLLLKIKENNDALNQSDLNLLNTDGLLQSSIQSINTELLAKMASSFISTNNTDYIRIGDFQICWGVSTKNTNGTATCYFPFTFPQPFISTPVIVNGINSASSGYMYSVYSFGLSNTQYNATLFENYAGRASSTPITFSYLAIGKWR